MRFLQNFDNSFLIDFTTNDGWKNINNYEFIMPDDWSSNKIAILIKLEKSFPEFSITVRIFIIIT